MITDGCIHGRQGVEFCGNRCRYSVRETCNCVCGGANHGMEVEGMTEEQARAELEWMYLNLIENDEHND